MYLFFCLLVSDEVMLACYLPPIRISELLDPCCLSWCQSCLLGSYVELSNWLTDPLSDLSVETGTRRKQARVLGSRSFISHRDGSRLCAWRTAQGSWPLILRRWAEAVSAGRPLLVVLVCCICLCLAPPLAHSTDTLVVLLCPRPVSSPHPRPLHF